MDSSIKETARERAGPEHVPIAASNVGAPVKGDQRLGSELLSSHVAGAVPNSLVFQRFHPSVLIGRHQVFSKEAREAWCEEQGIVVMRRQTAGGALYMDEGQQAFHMVVPSDILGKSISDRLHKGAEVLAAALASLGIKTNFKAPNDLQVDGRQKIGSVFLAEKDGSTLLFGTIIVELDLKAAMQALLVPTEKLTVSGLEHARERMTSLSEQLGKTPPAKDIQEAIGRAVHSALNIDIHVQDSGILTLAATEPDDVATDWEPRPERFETKDKVPCATLRLMLGVAAGNALSHFRVSTDGHFSPAHVFDNLGDVLAGHNIGNIASQARTLLDSQKIDCAGFETGDVIRLIERAVTKKLLQDDLGLSPEQTSGVMLAGNGRNTVETLEKASVMLVPYCAKPGWCKWRHTIDCVECGQCEVGDAYIMARERNMEVVTITNFEHLSDTLDKMKQVGVESYVGMCCGEFFLKRHHAFRDSGMDAVLLDIEGATCYELKEEHLAYAGAFKAEARLDIDAVGKVMAKVPARPASERPQFTGLARRPGERKYEAEENRKRCGGNCSCSAKTAVDMH